MNQISAVAMLSAENGGTEIIVRSDGAVFIRQDVAERVIERLRAEIADLKDELRALNQGAAHNANIDRSEIEFWKERAHDRG